jgi:hypothetical protein
MVFRDSLTVGVAGDEEGEACGILAGAAVGCVGKGMQWESFDWADK